MKTPVCSAILLADSVHNDPATGKVSLLGIFSELQAPKFPATTNCGLFVALTGGLGKVPYRVEITDPDESHTLLAFDRLADFPTAHHLHHFHGPIFVVWPAAGVYLLRVLCGGVEIGCKRLTVKGQQVSAPKDEAWKSN